MQGHFSSPNLILLDLVRVQIPNLTARIEAVVNLAGKQLRRLEKHHGQGTTACW